MEANGKAPIKKKMVTVKQLAQVLGQNSRKPNPKKQEVLSHTLRRSPRNKQIVRKPPFSTEKTHMARRSLFTANKKFSTPDNDVNDMNTSTMDYRRQELSLFDNQTGVKTSKMSKNSNVLQLKDAQGGENTKNSNDKTFAPGLRCSPTHYNQTNNSPPQQLDDGNIESMLVHHEDIQLANALDEHMVSTSRRRLRAKKEINKHGRGCNKTKMPKQSVFVDVNEIFQPIGDSARQLSSLLGCLARDPRRLSLDCFDWRLVEKEKKDAFWEEVKKSFHFPAEKDPYSWAMEKMGAAWRGYKCELKVAYFDERTHDEAIEKRPSQIPEEMWRNLVDFWESDKGKERSQKGIENRYNLKMAHYAGTMSFARIRAEVEAKIGKKMSEIDMWMKTHEPKKGSQLDDISAATKKIIEDKLAKLPEGSSESAKTEIFKSIVGEDKYGYVKIFCMGAKVPRSQRKRCSLEEERAKRLKSEEQVVKMQDQLDEAFGQIGELKSLLVKLCNHQRLIVEKENENHEENEEENGVGEFDSEDEELDEDEESEDLTLP